MEDFRVLFHKVLSHLGVYGSEAEQVFKTFFDQVYATFVDGLLKEKLPEEVYSNRIKEYQQYIKEGKQELLHKDLKYYIGDDAKNEFAKSYMELLKKFIHGIEEQGDITKQQVDEVGELIKNFILARKATHSMQSASSSEDSLKAIA
jgi:hypothetical protein